MSASGVVINFKLIYGPTADERDLTTKSENFKVMHILKIISM